MGLLRWREAFALPLGSTCAAAKATSRMDYRGRGGRGTGRQGDRERDEWSAGWALLTWLVMSVHFLPRSFPWDISVKFGLLVPWRLSPLFTQAIKVHLLYCYWLTAPRQPWKVNCVRVDSCLTLTIIVTVTQDGSSETSKGPKGDGSSGSW